MPMTMLHKGPFSSLLFSSPLFVFALFCCFVFLDLAGYENVCLC